MCRCTRQNIAFDICFTRNRGSAVLAKDHLLSSLALDLAYIHPGMGYGHPLNAIAMASLALEYSCDTKPKKTIHCTYGIPPNLLAFGAVFLPDRSWKLQHGSGCSVL